MGMVVMALGGLIGAAASIYSWPEMADTLEEITGPSMNPSTATRLDIAVGLPIVMCALAIFPWLGIRLDKWIGRHIPGYQGRTIGSNRARGWSTAWIGFAVVLVTLHLSLVATMAGYDVPILKAISVTTGLLLILLGSALPLSRYEPNPDSSQDLHDFADRLGRANRPAAFSFVGTGVAVMALGLLSPVAALAIAIIAMLAIFGVSYLFALGVGS
ncbi:hypothetical protein [Rhodococcus erythropolis]